MAELIGIRENRNTLSPFSENPDGDSLPGWDAIGYSYDVFGFYANPRSVLKPLFRLSPHKQSIHATWKISTDVEYREIRDAAFETDSFISKDAYTKELAKKVNLCVGNKDTDLFSASLETDFSDNLTDKTDCSYTLVRTAVNKWKLKLLPTVECLRDKLIPSVKDALEKMEPFQLLDTYGTHYLSEVLVGGRADYVATTKASTFNQKNRIRVAAEASFRSITDKKVSPEMKELVEKFEKNSSTRLSIIGGNAMLRTTEITDTAAYTEWLKSIDTSPVFCGFTKDSLRPLWELAQSDQRRQALEKAAKTYVSREVTRNAIVEVDVVVGENSQVNPPHGFKKIDYNLNRNNVWGKYIYLCYKKDRVRMATALSSSSDLKPITSLHVAYGDNDATQVPPGYTKIPKNLNWGAGGKIYLCYSRDPSKAPENLPIRGLRVVGNKYVGNVVTPYGFERIDACVNKGNWGDRIFICYSRHLE